jgi:hypothetical protein
MTDAELQDWVREELFWDPKVDSDRDRRVGKRR